jgi:L-asparaginase
MRVEIVTTGGTIASRIDPATGAAVPAVRADELLAVVPRLGEIAGLRTTEFCLESSWNVTPGMMCDLARTIGALQADPATVGVVVTHGTDTMEETAFALDLLLPAETPVVLTGAMRNASLPGADGPRNLLAAVRVAAQPAARGVGALVVMNDEVHSARHVTKTHASALDTFASPSRGPVGRLDSVGLTVHWHPRRPPPLPIAAAEPRVHLLECAAGADPALLRAALATGARGLVVAGSGAGNVYREWEAPMREAIDAGVPVVLATRCGAGRVVPEYGAPGGGRRLHDLGVVPAGDLTGRKARIALMLALGAGMDLSALRDYFAVLVAAGEAPPLSPSRRSLQAR